MSGKRRNFRRPLGNLPYRKLFVIAAEGEKTERQYFALFDKDAPLIRVKCLKSSHESAPHQVLTRMNKYLKQSRFRSSDEAWLVVDKDQWTDEQLNQLVEWAGTRENHGFALSNPNFEYWLLLHFEDGSAATSSRTCTERLNRHIPGYDKRIKAGMFTRKHIDDAISRARQRDKSSSSNQLFGVFGSTVYKLVCNILCIRREK